LSSGEENGMELEVDRSDLHRTRILDDAPLALPATGARVRVDAFALTSNNITYAAFGDVLQYWDFFPASATDGGPANWGRVPVWGFADVVESNVPELAIGRRIYGYFPMAEELVVEPGRFDDRAFQDLAPHRQSMAATYNRYLFADADPIYAPDRESHQMVLWPLFFTSFLIDDFLADNEMFGASTIVLSSASSKTAIGTAFLLASRPDLHVVGLTSAANVEFVRSLGCYRDTIAYEDVGAAGAADAVFVDIAGNADVRAAVHGHFADRLRYSMVVGGTHWDHQPAVQEAPIGPNLEFFFAPTQVAKRAQDWGQAALDKRVGEAWRRYTGFVDSWLEFASRVGAREVEETYQTLLAGQVDPRIGYVCSMRA
jgi:Protein of unknown function (DUF2855)